MNIKKLIALIIIFAGASIAWVILGTGTMVRSDESYRQLVGEVKNLFGSQINLYEPDCFAIETVKKEVIKEGKKEVHTETRKIASELVDTDLQINLLSDPRKRGNLWFPTFHFDYRAEYRFITSEFQKGLPLYLVYNLKSNSSIFKDIELIINGNPVEDIKALATGGRIPVKPAEDGSVLMEISYKTTGMEKVFYKLTDDANVRQVHQFKMVMDLDLVEDWDFPTDCMSPASIEELDKGSRLTWELNDAFTSKDIGIIMPRPLNPGEITSRISFFAPVSLLFFFAVLLIISLTMKTMLHPMHYFFLSATFFSFHLMTAYFADHMHLYIAFAVAAVISIVLTVTYMRLFSPAKIAWLIAPAAQLIYLIVFSWSFFFDGISGLIITICAVVTLFLLMQITGRVDWNSVFKKEDKKS